MDVYPVIGDRMSLQTRPKCFDFRVLSAFHFFTSHLFASNVDPVANWWQFC